jgi:hypothetical protein
MGKKKRASPSVDKKTSPRPSTSKGASKGSKRKAGAVAKNVEAKSNVKTRSQQKVLDRHTTGREETPAENVVDGNPPEEEPMNEEDGDSRFAMDKVRVLSTRCRTFDYMFSWQLPFVDHRLGDEATEEDDDDDSEQMGKRQVSLQSNRIRRPLSPYQVNRAMNTLCTIF